MSTRRRDVRLMRVQRPATSRARAAVAAHRAVARAVNRPSMAVRSYGAPRAEAGYVDLAADTYNHDTTGEIVLVATIAQGASQQQRVGKKVLYKSLQLRGFIQAGSTGTVADAALIFVYDRRPTGSLPNITDVLNTANSLSMNNDANTGRFKILRRFDWTMIGNNATPSTGREAATIDEYVKLNGLPLVCKAVGTGAIGDIEEGAIYMISVGNVVAGTTAAVTSLTVRTRFVDV